MEGETKKSSTTAAATTTSTTTAHVLVFPYPIQGHINPMLQFSKRLSSKGLKVTHITTFTLSKSLPPQPESDLIQTRPIFDGLKEGEKINNHEAYLEIFQRVMPQSLVDVIEEYKKTSDPVKFIVYDCLLPWVLDLARKVGIDGAPFYTQTAAVHSIHYHVYEGALGTPIEGSLVSMPSMPLLRVDDMPSLIANPAPYPAINRLNINQSSNFDKANFSFINTIDMLEDQVVNWMKKQWPIKTIGPAIPSMYLDKRLEDDKDYGLSMFKPETDTCIRWLDARETGSVVYVSMGSLSSLGKEQMEEMAMGLENCNKYFLWVVRASEKNKLPLDFQEKTSEKGLIVNWCPQLEVLAHRALGCFVTHCGWNSILEAISLGVPMVAFPQWTDQPTNAKFLADVWKIGVRINRDEQGIATRKEIESCILEVMEGERAKEIKSNANKWKQVITEAMEEGGSSDRNIDEFVAKMLSS